eukprot:1822893-Pleurochrysis_carterae.AAC.4
MHTFSVSVWTSNPQCGEEHRVYAAPCGAARVRKPVSRDVTRICMSAHEALATSSSCDSAILIAIARARR